MSRQEQILKQHRRQQRDETAAEVQQPGGGPDELTIEVLGLAALAIANINKVLDESSPPSAA